MRIHKGDTVQIISGKDRGKTAKVLKVFPRGEKILVEGAALIKKHRRPRRQGQKGEVVTLPSSIHASNAMPLCKNCSRGVRVGFEFLDDGSKVRICKKCKSEI